jgi:rhodanese-related sulfurtransferase
MRQWLFAALTLFATQAMAQISVDQMREIMAKQEAVVFDIREPQEHATGVAEGMKLLPMSQLRTRYTEIPKDQPVLLICNTQNRSRGVTTELQRIGYTNVRFVNGGMKEWADRKLPLVKPSQP